MLTYKIHLIRTGKTSGGILKQYVGQNDLPLCDSGIQNLRILRENNLYPPADMIYSSPLRRCRQTVEILYPDTFVDYHPGLMDMNLGEFEGKTFEELRGEKEFSLWIENSFENTPPGGEDAATFVQRLVGTLDDIFRQMTEERITSIAVVTHGGVIMTLLAAVGLPKMPLHEWAVDNGCGYTVQMTTQMWLRDHKCEVVSSLPENA